MKFCELKSHKELSFKLLPSGDKFRGVILEHDSSGNTEEVYVTEEYATSEQVVAICQYMVTGLCEYMVNCSKKQFQEKAENLEKFLNDILNLA